MRELGIGLLVLGLAVLAGCKTPRQPHSEPENDISGAWTARSGQPVPRGWNLRLEQELAGRLRGSGAVTHADGTSTFSVTGVRGTREIDLDFDLEDAAGRFDGSIMSVDLIVGSLYLNGDTIALTFERD